MRNNPFPKKKLLSLFIFIFAQSILFAQSFPIPLPKHYIVYKTPTTINVDGKLDEKDWAVAQWTAAFIDIIGEKGEKPFQETHVKMLWDSQYFYVAAVLYETDIWGTLQNRDTVIYYDNDFEIFIDPNGDNHNYIELEINALNTVWDLFLQRPYRDSVKANSGFNMPNLKTGVGISGTLNNPSDTDEKWVIEMAIPWQDIAAYLPQKRIPRHESQWRINFSRVQWDVDIINKKYIPKRDEKGKLLPEHNWVWTSQYAVNMHRPETWGYVQFSDKIIGNEKVEFQKDLDFDLKMALMEVYQLQKKYWKKKGHYALKMRDLPLSKYNKIHFSKIIQLKTTSSNFSAKANGLKAIWRVDKYGQLLFQDYLY